MPDRPEQPDARIAEAARARAASLVDEIERDAVERAVARVRERLTDDYARVLEEAVLTELAHRARARPRDASPVSDPRPAAEPADEPLGWYLYALVSGPRRGLAAEPGLDPAFPVEVIGDDELAAVGSPARLSLLQAGQERADLSPDGWFATALRRHEQLVESAGETVIPMRFGTVYPDADRVRRLLAGNRDVVLDELRRLAGQSEWGVKLIAARPPSRRTEPAREADGAVPVSGAGYLRRKAETRSNAQAASQARRELVASVHDQLAGFATGAVVTPVQRTGGESESILLNASYLVRADDLEAFQRTAAQLAEEVGDNDAEVQLTGPWPPYHFVELRLSDEGGPP